MALFGRITVQYEGERIQVPYLTGTDASKKPSIKITDVARASGNYTLHFMYWLAGTWPVTVTIGNKSETQTLQSVAQFSEPKKAVFHLTDVTPDADGAIYIEIQGRGSRGIALYHMMLEKSTTASDWSPNPDDIEETMQEAASHAVDYLTQEALFNKLTNNGALQGLFMQNGELYMNATYIRSGVLSGAQINIGDGNFTVDSNGRATASDVTINGGSVFLTTNYRDGTPISGYIRISQGNGGYVSLAPIGLKLTYVDERGTSYGYLDYSANFLNSGSDPVGYFGMRLRVTNMNSQETNIYANAIEQLDSSSSVKRRLSLNGLEMFGSSSKLTITEDGLTINDRTFDRVKVNKNNIQLINNYGTKIASLDDDYALRLGGTNQRSAGFKTDYGLWINDAQGVTRVRLTMFALTFYDSQGNVTKIYNGDNT